MSCLTKPVLRGHVKRAGIQYVITSLIVGCTCGGLYHFLVANPARERFNKWVETYDAKAHCKDLMKWGYIK